MPRDPDQLAQDLIRIRHMIDAALKARRFCDGKAMEDLEGDDMLLLATEKAVEIIGEASTLISDETKARLPEVEWRRIRQMRNRMIHGYDSISVEILWNTVQTRLPELIKSLETALERLQP